MSGLTRRTSALRTLAVLATFAISADQANANQGAIKDCKVNDARMALSNGSLSDLCSCNSVTRGMIRYLQNRHDFTTILDSAEAACLPLATVLSDVPTATVRNRRNGPDNDTSSGFLETIGFTPNNFGGGNDPGGSSGGSGSSGSGGGNDSGGSGGGSGSSGSGGGNDSGGSGGGRGSSSSGGGNDSGSSGGASNSGNSGGGNNGNGKGGGSKSNSGGGNGSEGTPDRDPGNSGKNRGKD